MTPKSHVNAKSPAGTKSPLWKRSLTAPLIIIASLLMWIEESLWQWFKWLTAKIAIFAWVRKVEAAIRELSPSTTIVVFFSATAGNNPFQIAGRLLADGRSLACESGSHHYSETGRHSDRSTNVRRLQTQTSDDRVVQAAA